MQIELQDNDLAYQDEYEVEQRTLQIDILKQIFTATNEKLIQIILTFKDDLDRFQSFKQLHRKLKANIVTEFNNVLVQKFVSILKTFMLEKQFFQTKTQKATLQFISKVIIEEKIVQVSQDLENTIYQMFRTLISLEDFIDLSRYMRYLIVKKKQLSDTVAKNMFYLYHEKAQQKEQDELKFLQTYKKLNLEDKTTVQLRIILCLSSQHSKYKIQQTQFSKKMQILKKQPFKKLLQFIVKKKKTKDARLLRMAILKAKFELNQNDQIQYKFGPTIQICEQLRTYQTLELVAYSSYSSEILNEIANDATIYQGTRLYVKWPIQIINSIQEKLMDDQNQISILQNFQQILRFLKVIFQNRDKQLITKLNEKKMIQEKSQNKNYSMVEYFCKVFDTFSKYISRNSLELTQRTLTLNEQLPSTLIQQILKYFVQLINMKLYSTQKWFQEALQSVFTFMAHIFYRRQYQNITGYDTDISKNLRQIMVKVQSFSLKWRRLRNAKVLIDRWAETVPESSEDYKLIIKKFLTAYFHKNVTVSSKSTSTVFNPLFMTRAYSNIFSSQLLQFIVKFSKDLQKFNGKQMYNSQAEQQADAVMSKIILFLSSRLKISSIKVCQILILVYKRYAHIVPSIYTFRAWLLMGKQGTVNAETKIGQSLSEIIDIHQFFQNQILQIPTIQLISKGLIKEQSQNSLNLYKKTCKTVISELQLKLKNDVFGQEIFNKIFNIIQTQMYLMQKLQNKITESMKNEKQTIGNILVQNSLTSTQSAFETIENIYNDFKMVIRYYICNAQKVLNTQDQAYLIKVITQWIVRQVQKKNIKAIIQANQMLAYSSPAPNSHLSKKQVLGALRNLHGNDQLNLNQPQFFALNMVVSFHQNIYPNYKNILRFLLSHKKYTLQPTFFQSQTNSLIKWMKNLDKLKELNQNIQSGNCRLMIKNIVFPMTNYGGACIFNGKTQQKGKQQMVLGVYLSQIQAVFELSVNQIITLNFRQHVKNLLSVLKNKISRIVEVKNNRIQGRYRSNRQRRSFTEATQQLIRLNIPEQLIQLALQNVQIPDPQLALQWIQNNQGRLDQILFQRVIKKSKEQKKMIKQPSLKQKQKGFFIQMLSYSSFKDKVEKDMKNLVRKLAQQLFSQKGDQIRILLFILLDSFSKDDFKNKNYKKFSQKMFKQIDAIALEPQINSRKLNLIIAVLTQNIGLCPSITVDLYAAGINLKLLNLVPHLNQADTDKVFQLLSTILPSFKENQKIEESVFLYLEYMLQVISNSGSSSTHISTIMYKIVQSANQNLKKKVIAIFKDELVKGVFKKKLPNTKEQVAIDGIFTAIPQSKQISVFSSILLLFESDQRFSKANIQLQLKGFIIQNYRVQILKVLSEPNQQNSKKAIIQINIKKFSISFQRFQKNKRFNQVCHQFLSKKKTNKQSFFFNTGKHNLFESQTLGQSYLSYNHKSEQQVIIDCLVDLFVTASTEQQQQIYLLQIHKLLQYYKLLIPFVIKKNILGKNMCQWIIEQCLVKNRKKYEFLLFLTLNNNLYKSISQPLSIYTSSLIINSFKKAFLNKSYKNETTFILMYLLQMNQLNKLCLVKFSQQENISLKQILQTQLLKCSQLLDSNPIKYMLLSECISILQKRKLIDKLKSKYQIITESTESISQRQFLQMNLLYRIELNEQEDVSNSKKKREGGPSYLSNPISFGNRSRLIVDQMDDQQNQLEQDGDDYNTNLRELLRMRLAPRQQNPGRNQQVIFIPIQEQNENISQENRNSSINESQNQAIQQLNIPNIQTQQVDILSQQYNLSQGRVNYQQKTIRQDLKKEVQKDQKEEQQVKATIQDFLNKFKEVFKLQEVNEMIEEENMQQKSLPRLPKQNTKITQTLNCTLNVADPKQKLQNSTFKKINIFQKRFISLITTIDPNTRQKFEIKRPVDASLGRKLADRLLLSGDVASRQQMITHIQRLIHQRVQDEQVQRVRPMNLTQIVVGLQQEVDPPPIIQRAVQQQILSAVQPPIQEKPQVQSVIIEKGEMKQQILQINVQQIQPKEQNSQLIRQEKLQSEKQQKLQQKIQYEVEQANKMIQQSQINEQIQAGKSQKQLQKMEVEQNSNQLCQEKALNKPQEDKKVQTKKDQIQIQKNQKPQKFQQKDQNNQNQNPPPNQIIQRIPVEVLQEQISIEIPHQIVQNTTFRQILVMFNLPQTFLADNGIDAELFDQLPQQYQIDQITHYMGLAQQNSSNLANNSSSNNQNNPPQNQEGNNQNVNVPNNNQQAPRRNSQDEIVNQNIALFASMDPQTRAQMLADYPPQFLLTLPVQMRTQVEQFRQRQIGRMLQQQQRQQMLNYQNQRVDPNFLRAPHERKNYKKLKYPSLKKIDFNQIQEKTAESLAKCLFLKFGKLRTHEGFRVLLQNKWTEDKALATLIILLKEKNHYQITQGQYDSQKQIWKFQRVLLEGYQMKRFKGKLLALIYESIKHKSYKDQNFLCQKIPNDNYLGQISIQENAEFQADKQGMYPLYELLEVSIDIHPQLSVQLIKKCKKLPNLLIQKIVESIKCDKLISQFYQHLEFLSENQYIKQLFQKQFTEEKPPKIQNFARLLKYKFSKVPYLKKMHENALKNFTPAYYQFLNQIFSIYSIEDIKQIQQLLIKYKHVHFQIIKQLYAENRSLDKEPMGIILKMPHLLDFQTKKYLFRKHPKIKKNSRYPLPIQVDRTNIFQQSYNQIMSKTPRQLEGRLQISFRDQQGYDAGGLTRQWLMCLSRQIFNPDYALFQPSSSGNTYQPNPKSHINPDHLLYFKFVGRFVGKALADNELVDAYFTRAFYKMILGQQIQLSDLQQQDYPFYKSMIWLKQNPIEQGDYTFSYLYDNFGNRIVKELIPNGKNVIVTQENKNQYVQKYCHAKMRQDFKVQVQKFLQGFHQIIPHQCITFFQAKQLELLISGLPQIDFEDLKKNVDYSNYQPTDPIILWFWEIVQQYTQQDLARLIQFITGTSKIPVDGFANLKGMNGPQRISIHKDPVTHQLPKAHTCFNQLDLPNYSNKQLLKQKLRTAITWGSQGFGFM